jgi:hypothetical protein
VTELIDIRELKDDPEAYAAELERRWGGLLSYRYIGRNFASMNVGPADNTVAVRRDLRNAAGGLLMAPLSICSPEGNVGTDMETVPNPVIHSCQILDPGHDVQRVEVGESEVLHSGTRMGYSRSHIVDADNPDRVIALIEGQGARIGTTPDGLGRVDGNMPGIEDSPDLPPLWQAFGAQRRDDGHWIIPELRIDLASPDAALHVGPQFVLLETAAIDDAAELVGTDKLQMQSWHVMYMARGKAGPFRVDGEAFRGHGDAVAVRMVTHDEGNGDRAITSACAVFKIVG